MNMNDKYVMMAAADIEEATMMLLTVPDQNPLGKWAYLEAAAIKAMLAQHSETLDPDEGYWSCSLVARILEGVPDSDALAAWAHALAESISERLDRIPRA